MSRSWDLQLDDVVPKKGLECGELVNKVSSRIESHVSRSSTPFSDLSSATANSRTALLTGEDLSNPPQIKLYVPAKMMS